MKKFFSFVAILAIVLASNCSRIPDNNDPVIGIWTSETSLTSSVTGKISTRFEWIFNDAFLGRYHVMENGNIIVKSDFKWTQEDGIYTITYPGLDKNDDTVTMKDTPEGTMLEGGDGTVFATRE